MDVGGELRASEPYIQIIGKLLYSLHAKLEQYAHAWAGNVLFVFDRGGRVCTASPYLWDWIR